jgi:hypothetical protein
LSIRGRKYPRDLYSSPNIRIIELETIGWMGQMRRGKKGNECRALEGIGRKQVT